MVWRRRRLLGLLNLTLALVLAACTTSGPSQLTGDSAAAGFDGSGRIVIRTASLVLTMDPNSARDRSGDSRTRMCCGWPLWAAQKCFGLDGEIGSLTPGKQADLQLINPAAVDFAPELDWISQLVFNAQPANVEWVFVAGRALKRDGHLVGDQSQVIADAQAASDRVQKLLGRNAHTDGR